MAEAYAYEYSETMLPTSTLKATEQLSHLDLVLIKKTALQSSIIKFIIFDAWNVFKSA